MRKFSGPSADYGTKSRRLIKHLGKTAWLITRHDGSQYAQPVFHGTRRMDPFAREYFIRIAPRFARVVKAVTPARAHPGTRQRGAQTRSSASSGDSNDADPEPPRGTLLSLNLYDQAALADLLTISKKTLQNLYSSAPHSLPVAISVPGARGPRWTPAAVAEWLSSRPRHTSTPAPVAPKRKVGRPRIAQAVKGGAA